MRLDASMYFRFGKSQRHGVTAKTCFEAVVKGERTSTTRFPQDGPEQFARWRALRPGDLVRIWSGPFKEGAFKGDSCLIEVTEAPRRVLLSEIDREAWSMAEGWAPEFLDFLMGRGRQDGVQVRYRMHTSPTPPAQGSFGF